MRDPIKMQTLLSQFQFLWHAHILIQRYSSRFPGVFLGLTNLCIAFCSYSSESARRAFV